MTTTAEIRLTVMTDNDDSPSNVGEACIVDPSQGLEHVIDIVSATVGFDVERLDLLIYSGDRVVSDPRVKDPKELTDGCMQLRIPLAVHSTCGSILYLWYHYDEVKCLLTYHL